MTKIAFCAIVKATDDEAICLTQLLANVSPHVDTCFITITGDNKKCEEVCKLFKAEVSHFKWVNDFAKARKFNFSQVSKDYTHILWGDADDMFRGLEDLKQTVKENPDVDAFLMNYLFAFDEYKNPTVVHMKTMMVKNNGCMEWGGSIHEDLLETRQLETKLLTGIERMHMTTDDRVKESKARNAEIAKKMKEDNPNDPRSYWNLGNSLKAIEKDDESIKAFDKFLEMSESDDEKYIARLRMAEIYWHQGLLKKAIDCINYAIGMKTVYPDAYILKGNLFASMGKFQEASEAVKLGLQMKPPYYSIVVYNPRDYDYNPMMLLAKIYLNMSMPNLSLPLLEACLKITPIDQNLKKLIKKIKKESIKADKAFKLVGRLRKIKDNKVLEKEFDKIPVEIRQHPALCNLRNTRIIKETSTGKDLVYYCSYTDAIWTPETARKEGIGGSEEAVINLSKGLAKKGWNVTVYNNCGHKEQVFDGVTYKPYWSYNYRDKQDITILWRHPKALDFDINSNKIFLDLHDVVPQGEFTKERVNKLDKIFVKTNAHRILFPKVEDDKFVVIPNGIDTTLFDKELERDPYHIVNFSSPDRSLEALVDILPKIREKLPKAIKDKFKFTWYYGWSTFDACATSSKDQEWKTNLMKKFNVLKDEGWVFGGGRINHQEVADLYLSSGAMLYPTEFYEIDFMGGSKSQIGGCVPITTDFGSLNEKIQYGIKLHSDIGDKWDKVDGWDFSVKDEKLKEEFIKVTVDHLLNTEKWDVKRVEMSQWGKDKFNWDNITEQWNKQLK